MLKKQMMWKTKGMNRDLSVSAFNPEFAFENRNLRLGTNDANTFMSWVTEKGTKRIELVRANWVEGDPLTRTNVDEIMGTPIGTAVINHQLVVFTTDTLHELDYIYVLKYADDAKTKMMGKMLFGGDDMSLGFSVEHPIETLVSYEAEDIQKVYWTDGVNQPRVINIEGNIRKNNNTQFDFVPTLQLQETVKIKKLLGANGMFAPGVIQYALTYYTKFGQESNIFYTSPLLYISYRDRGASPEDKVENAFRITVEGVDRNFDYLRIYSIQRTSIDATPICKRIQDISISALSPVEGKENVYKASYTDTGTTGDSIDPTELLFKGGEVISALTMEQKDNTLFLGNLNITRPQITESIKSDIRERTYVGQSTRQIQALGVSTGSYAYASQLTSVDAHDTERSVPVAGFKYGDMYRLGVQFQYVTGKWSDPVWVGDYSVENKPDLSTDNTIITLPTFTGTLSAAAVTGLVEEGYRKVRSLVVFPKLQDRNILCQGVINPTVYTKEHRLNNTDLYAQSSWFFRGCNPPGTDIVSSKGTVSPFSSVGSSLPYTHVGIASNVPSTVPHSYKYIPTKQIKSVEIQGEYDDNNKFYLDRSMVTFHSPDVEFDDQLALTDYASTKWRQVGYSQFEGTMSDIDIQVETPTISNLGSGFIHKSFKDPSTYGIVSGLFWDDFIVDDTTADQEAEFEAYNIEESPVKWMVYLWNRTGYLNNDCNRPADKGTPTSKLKKKVISNLRYAKTHFTDVSDLRTFNENKFPHMFSSNEVTILKFGTDIYMGNIDTSLIPNYADGLYFGYINSRLDARDVDTPFSADSWWKTFSKSSTEQDDNGVYKFEPSQGWKLYTGHIGDGYIDVVMKKDPVRMKYKSTNHLAFDVMAGFVTWGDSDAERANSLPVLEITQEISDETRFGGKSPDAFRENIWLPCGEPVLLTDVNDGGTVTFRWEYGDTYFQRWDCLKTYPFTREDLNQVVEIGSFMLETRVNIDGRYDRNRGQMNNLNMSPTNFNLMNPVYSQMNNFFQYRIQDEFFYSNNAFPNQITWSKTKTSGADTDLWTNVTLASILEMDGNKGEVRSLNRLNDQLICFQDNGIAHILYNENVQIQSTAGVPIEIANSGKVQGKDYKSNTVGCSNKWSIASGINGIYFMDSDGRNIYVFNGQLVNLSLQAGFNAWSKLHIPSNDVFWTPTFPDKEQRTAFISFYDRMNQEILFINRSVCLAYSEKYGVFTSFYDYNGTPFFENLDDTGVWLRANQLWKHQAGNYCNFFGAPRPYSMVLVGNPEPTLDKVFTNLEFRACVDAEGDYKYGTYRHYLPFDSLDTWNEYQHGMAYLNNMRGHSAMEHHTLDNEASLKRRFRIWRCDIPRDNGDNVDTFDETFDDTFHPLARDKKHPLDRMRNPWLYLRLRNSPDGDLSRTEIHDVVMTYYI